MPISLGRLWRYLRTELAPREGRWAIAWRTAAMCALVTLVFMAYGIPFAPIACYLVLFVMKPNTGASLLMGIGVLALVGVMVPALVGLVVVSVDHVVVRMLVLCVGTFVFMYLSVASKLGPIGSILALVVGFIMTLVGMAPLGEVLTRGILYAALMGIIPMGILLAFLLLLGPSPAQLAQQQLRRRCQTLAAAVEGETPAADLLAAVRAGRAGLDTMLLCARLFFQLPKARLQELQQLSRSLYLLMSAWVALPATQHIPVPLRARWARYFHALEHALANGGPMPAYEAYGWPDGEDRPAALAAIDQRLQCLPALPPLAIAASPLPPQGFLKPDALQNSEYVEFALKVTFSALICYLIYTALQWQDIHTAMITCYVAALGTVGETLHKLLLRIGGCLIGAAMGCAAIVWLMPHMTHISQLMALVFAGCLVAAWVALGSERTAYAGLQIGLAFVLTVLQGFGPHVQIAVALDRIYGILLGNVVLFIVFTQLWPVSTAARVRQRLGQLVDGLEQWCDAKPSDPRMQAALPQLLPELEALRAQVDVSRYEAAVLHLPAAEHGRMRQSINQLENVYLQAAFSEQSLQPPPIQQALRTLRDQAMTAGAA